MIEAQDRGPARAGDPSTATTASAQEPSAQEPSAQERVAAIVASRPADSSYDDILRELAFERLVRRGLDDLASGRMLTTEQLSDEVHSWSR